MLSYIIYYTLASSKKKCPISRFNETYNAGYKHNIVCMYVCTYIPTYNTWVILGTRGLRPPR